jgi:uncharacterized protein YbjT (DUF2867 family)
MDERILVTGGRGVLGRPVVERLLAAGHDRVRTTSRRPRPDERGPEWVTADLRTGQGVDAAVAEVGTIIHCAGFKSRKAEVETTGTLVRAALRAEQPPHLVYISIVGIGRIPLGYYRGKLEAEQLIEASGLPFTILRATQFHELVRVMMAVLAKAPVMLVPAVGIQPVDVGEVADRLVELALGEPAGRVPDIGGPQPRDARDLARSYLRATGRRRPVLGVRLPGRIFRALRQGDNMAAGAPFGRRGFEDYLAACADPGSTAYH